MTKSEHKLSTEGLASFLNYGIPPAAIELSLARTPEQVELDKQLFKQEVYRR